MSNHDAAVQHIVDVQERMFRLAKRDYGLTIRDLEAETKIPATTLRSYTKGAVMPITAFAKLCAVIPDELTSLMLPEGKHVGTDRPADDGDVAQLAEESAEFNVEYLHSTSPRSEGGKAITPRELGNLKDRARRLTAVARKVAA
jgi:hypothetical protein